MNICSRCNEKSPETYRRSNPRVTLLPICAKCLLLDISQLSEAQIAYIAGIIDGEGTIQINLVKRTKLSKRTWVPALFISNSDLRILSWVQKHVGGSINRACTRKIKNRKTVYRLQFYGPSRDELVRRMIPYLVAKKSQAELFLEMRGRRIKNGATLPPDEVYIRDLICEKCRILNERGGVERKNNPHIVRLYDLSEFIIDDDYRRPTDVLFLPRDKPSPTAEDLGIKMYSLSEYAAKEAV